MGAKDRLSIYGLRGDLVIAQPESTGVSGDTEISLGFRALNENAILDISAGVRVRKRSWILGSMNSRGVDVQMGAGELKMDLREASGAWLRRAGAGRRLDWPRSTCRAMRTSATASKAA